MSVSDHTGSLRRAGGPVSGNSPLFRRFSIPASSSASHSVATDHCSRAAVLPYSPLAARHSPLATTSYDPPPAGNCHPPTAELPKTERDPISTIGPSLSVCHRNRRFVRTKSTDSSPLAAARPLTIRSWPETHNASGSRRAGPSRG